MLQHAHTVNVVYLDAGKVRLQQGTVLNWHELTDAALPSIPYGSNIAVTVAFDEVDYLNGSTGIVWATYHLEQAETIQAALLAQSIACEVCEHSLPGARLYVLRLPAAHDVASAADFIWREPSGLRLRPDWSYPAGAENESFVKWINGV